MNIVGEIELRFHEYWDRQPFVRCVESRPIVVDDPKLLFVNSGMAPFKPAMVNGDALASTAIAQKCLRTRLDDGGLVAFEMLTVVGEFDAYYSIAPLWMTFLESLLNGSCGSLHFVFNPQDVDLLAPIQHEKYQSHEISENNDNFWIEWGFGQDFLTGRGLTVVWENCTSASNAIENNDDRFAPLGNLVIIENRRTEKKYFDIGFGLQRLAATRTANNEFLLEPMSRAIQFADSICSEPLGCEICRLLDGIKLTAGAGVVPGAKKHGYLLRKMIRRLWVVIERASPNKSRSTLDAILENHEKGSGGWTKVIELVNSELDSFERVLQRNLKLARKYLKKRRGSDTELILALRDTFGIPAKTAQRLIREV